MDDLISRAAAMDAIDGMKPMRGNMEQLAMKALCWAAVKTIQPVDAAPIIRCADCKWWNGSTLGAAHRCAALHIATTGEFYCAAAERKSNAYADQSGAEYADNPTV